MKGREASQTHCQNRRYGYCLDDNIVVRVKPLTIFVIFSLLLTAMFIIPAYAVQTNVNYSIQTKHTYSGSLADADVIIETDWSVAYTANDATAAPGETVSYPITAAPGPGSVTVWWWYNGTTIQLNNKRTISHDTPIGDEANIPLYSDPTVTITLTIYSSIDAVVMNTGPGTVSPSMLMWTSWGTQTTQGSVDAGATDGQTVALSTSTTYSETLTVTFDVIGLPVTPSFSPVTKSGDGDKPVTNSITVVVPKHLVSGYVYKSGTSQGIAGATVSASPGSYSTTTDSTGHYSLTVADGSYTLSVSATGYLPTSASLTISGADVTKDFYLAPSTHTISGSICKSGTSQEIVGATIAASPGGYSTMSNATGHYLLTLADGTYTLSVSASGYQSSSASVTVSGMDVTKNFYLEPIISEWTISGFIYKLGATEGIPGATVTASPGGYSAISDSTGHYSLTVPDGTYTVLISASGYNSKSVSVIVSGASISRDFSLVQPSSGALNDTTSWLWIIALTGVVVGMCVASVFVLRARIRKLCVQCGKKVPRAAIICPFCGRPT